MSSRPLVSVVMAVHNGEAHLAEALDSVLAQSLDDWELVLIDDGCTDGSPEVIARYTDDRVRVIRNPANLGLSRSLNRGLRAARGAFVARQDADDISEPDRLLRQARFLEANPAVALLGSWYTEIDAAGRPRQRVRLPTDSTALRWALLLYCPIVHSAAMFRREPVLSEAGGYAEHLRFSMDYELWTRIAARFEIANLPEYLVRYRIHDDAMSATFGPLRAEGSRMRAAKVAAMLGWTDAAQTNYERWEAMAALLLGWVDDHSTGALERATSDLLLLQSAFADGLALRRAERTAHRQELVGRLAEQLILNAASRVAARPAEALRLGRAGVKMKPTALINPRVLRKSVGRLAVAMAGSLRGVARLPGAGATDV